MANAKITDDEFLKLLAEYEYNFKKGDLLKGTVIAFTSEGAIVDIGAKSAAICPEYEIKISKTDNVEDIIKIGETYEFLITEEEDDEDGDLDDEEDEDGEEVICFSCTALVPSAG